MAEQTETVIYRNIKNAIIQQKLRPNMQLVEDVIAESFGVSRTPVRSVLRRLAHEKLVTIIPHKGTYVACPTIDESKEVFKMRKLLEAEAVREACKHLTDKEYSELITMINEEHEAQQRGDMIEVLQLSCDFHLRISELSTNALLYRYLEELVSQNYVIMAFYGHRQLELCGHQEHKEILDAMKKGKAEHAANLMVEHLEEIETYLNFDTNRSMGTNLKDILDPYIQS